ncbi:MAG: dienelactone hydrolase family protein [Pseudomonadota bacterium]
MTAPTTASRPALTQEQEQQVYDLYDEYCHGGMDRREFLRRSAAVVAGTAALFFAQSLLPRYAQAQTIKFTDARIKATYVDYESDGGTSGSMRGYLVVPRGEGPFPGVLVLHENRGLNPYIEDVARRAAVAGFVALAPDGLSPVGGYPGNDDDGRTLQRSLDQAKLKKDMLNSAYFLKSHEACNGKLGATGFCWGGGTVNYLAVTMGDDLDAGVPYYGRAADPEDVPAISAPLMIQAAEDDPRVNALWPEFEAALKEHGKDYTHHLYSGTRHGFHNNSTPRFNERMADIAWQRTIAFFREHLA